MKLLDLHLFGNFVNQVTFKVSAYRIMWVVKRSTEVNIHNVSLIQFKLGNCIETIMTFIFISIRVRFHVSIYKKSDVCIAATIRSAIRIEKVNSINRGFELSIVRIISLSDIISNFLPNN